MFLHVSVILFTGGGVCPIECWDTHTHPGTRGRHPPGTRGNPQTRSRCPPPTLPGADTPLGPEAGPPPRADTPPGPEAGTPPPRADTPPPGPEAGTPQRSACWEIWATSGRYASYWNAILFKYTSYSKRKYFGTMLIWAKYYSSFNLCLKLSE